MLAKKPPRRYHTHLGSLGNLNESKGDLRMRTKPSPVVFPPLEEADQNGLVMLGGDLSPDWLLEAYRRGIFPWPIFGDDDPMTWWSPDPRGVIELDGLHVSRSLRRTLRSGRFRVTCNSAFAAVVEGCAEPRASGRETWITSNLKRAYLRLHHLGFAHSVEAWRDGRLAGGVYGVALGGLFAAESMFHRERDASKVALAHLVSHLRASGFQLLDIQERNEHTARLGAIEIPRWRYLERLAEAVAAPAQFGNRLRSEYPTQPPEGDSPRWRIDSPLTTHTSPRRRD